MSLKLTCHHCGFVMYKKPVVYKFLEFCDSKCVEEWKDVQALVGGVNEEVVPPQKQREAETASL